MDRQSSFDYRVRFSSPHASVSQPPGLSEEEAVGLGGSVNGGTGGVGRIVVRYGTTVSGTTTPAADIAVSSFSKRGRGSCAVLGSSRPSAISTTASSTRWSAAGRKVARQTRLISSQGPLQRQTAAHVRAYPNAYPSRVTARHELNAQARPDGSNCLFRNGP